jgi:vacuolar-type H+-ATPase subunit B/Vma2
MKIKVSAVLNIDDNMYGTEESEMEWFREMIADKENTMLILHSNDVGDTIGETFDFDWEILNDEQQLPQQEISDEEIEKAADKYVSEDDYNRYLECFKQGAKWYREQLKHKL